eukprot:CAMPEP_0194305616 /NCGR_PEP_ID=MMETSP0171-20130528/3012_1 /TAXON_ID=218684 /ORGANISM="Corethron pennatum, Strain L29A3" /LENGTH=261 /DNA_ID=CAMNT_0039057195 /DNA_START=61 /DNA_END=843 /DNA_ORIENTATION=-
MYSSAVLGLSIAFASVLPDFSSAFHLTAFRTWTRLRPSSPITTELSSEAASGDSSVSEELPPLNPAWIEAARRPLPWERELATDNNTDANSWQNGQRWYLTRTALMDLWVLPRDMSNGSWDNYADAAIREEEKVLRQVPQLLRLDTDGVVASARCVMNELQLSPALLRSEPILLGMEPERLRGGFESVRLSIGGDTDSSLVEACRDTQGLLVGAATKWTGSEDYNNNDNNSDTGLPGTSRTDSIQLLQKSFDNEVSADDLH